MEKIREKTENICLPKHILFIMDRLEKAGEEVYLVGGSLRDLLLGRIPSDYDLATSALPERTMEIFSDHRVIATGLKHGTVTVMKEGEAVEITTFRIDGTYTDARHPDGVTFTKRIEEDLSRRDFTVNAMAYHPCVGLVDPFCGKEDLERKILRAVREPELRFSEDALRILRVFRFSAQLGFDIEEKTLLGCTNSKFGLTKVAKERISVELLRLILSENPSFALEKMMETGVISFVLGETIPSKKILKDLGRMPKTDTARLGFLLSEFEKDTVRDTLKTLKYSNKQITGVCAVVTGAKHKICTPSEVRKLKVSCGIYAEEACFASVFLQNSPQEALVWIKKDQAITKMADLKISGRDLMALGIYGRDIGEILQRLFDLVLEDPSLNQTEILLELSKKLVKTNQKETK